MPKPARQERLAATIQNNPFVTDEELAAEFGVSIQTIRLDRMELGIPEVRERIKQMAAVSQSVVRSLPMDEVIGDVIDLQLDKSGISILEVGEEHVFSRTGIARGHHIFAQANSLAVALINDEVALTASADIRYLRPVRLGERCVAKGYVKSAPGDKGKAKVEVFTYVGDDLVFQGHFVIYRSGKTAEARGVSNDANRH
ncbi:transcription factor FapR [Paenibacillus sp.]|uniref:transcription factor FapR n=1 Tax=Paenibacillus sp. TaxID=58172 RepID=UPI002D519F8F|nr:transcription factor FapR [Paenibacillus sp.]HZG84441.1 transcription factor FapR [Paenibacillus sp.]